MSGYIHEQPDWPKFRFDQNGLAKLLAAVRHRQGKLIGHTQALGFAVREEAILRILTEDVVKSSEIEGEVLDPGQSAPLSPMERLPIRQHFPLCFFDTMFICRSQSLL